MTHVLMTWVLRLLLGSFIVFAVQAMVGRGSIRPAVQLACACFMTVLILEPLLERRASANGLAALIAEAEEQISRPVQAALNDAGIAIQSGIEAELEELLQAGGMPCRICLAWDRDGVLVDADYWAEQSYAEAIKTQLAAYTGLPSEKIRYMGEDTDGYS